MSDARDELDAVLLVVDDAWLNREELREGKDELEELFDAADELERLFVVVDEL